MFQAESAQMSSQTPSNPMQSQEKSRVVLGQNILSAIHEDMAKIELPSWVNQAPMRFGLKSHGKLSASQWHTVCTIHLPITLTRLWGKESGYKQHMLENFLCLVAAVDLGTARTVSQETIQLYEKTMMTYLTTMKNLYPEATIKPNHHCALHISDFSKGFGPIHSIQTSGFERMNYKLQLTNTNYKFGEMEATFMNKACQAANIRSLIGNSSIQPHMADLVTAFEAFLSQDKQGTQIRNVLTSVISDDMIGQCKNLQMEQILDPAIYAALIDHLNQEANTALFAAYGGQKMHNQMFLSPFGRQCTHIKIKGIKYEANYVHSGNSNVAFVLSSSGPPTPGWIKEIFLHKKNNTDTLETFIAVQELEPLSFLDVQHDSFRKYASIAGVLYYEEYIKTIKIIRPKDIFCHITKLSLDVPGINKPCLHVLPLNRVCYFYLILFLLADILLVKREYVKVRWRWPGNC
jgi:hypothetical protein